MIFSVLSSYVLNAQEDSTVKGKSIIRKSPVTILREDLKSILDNPDLANAEIGVYVRSCKNGGTIFKMNESKNFIPASLTKLFTTSAALDFFKPDFRFSTRVYLDGSLSKTGTFEGNVIIRASGDPSISEKFNVDVVSLLKQWARTLDSLGIKEINGNLICDDRYFDNQYYAPGWCVDDLIYPFAAPIEAIAVHDNTIKFMISPGDSVGDFSKIEIIPHNNFVDIRNGITTVAYEKPEGVLAERNEKLEIIELSGTIPYDSTKKHSSELEISINNPVSFFLSLFKEVILEEGIGFNGALLDYSSAGYDIDYRNMNPIIRYSSPSLLNIITNINKESNNLAAEMLLKTLGKEGSGEGSFAAGVNVVKKYCKSIGIPSTNVIIFDGSGLSRYNLLQPKYLVDLLFKIYFSDYREIFIGTLARPGEYGTLKRRLTHSKAEKRVFAKTGSMNNVMNLAGYITTQDGEYLSFAIMIMNHNVQESLVQNIIDLFCMRLATFSRKE